VQGILKGAGASGSMVADSHPDGSTRGLVSGPARTSGLALGDGAMLQMMRTLRNGALQQGITDFGGGNMSAALMEYLLNSEQITSVIAVAALLDHGELSVAGGYIVQLLPEAKPETLAAMTDRLTRLPSIESLLTLGKGEPRDVVAALLAGTEYTHLEETEQRFACRCSQERLLATLGTLGPGEIRSMIDEGKPIDINCDYCNRDYQISVDELRTLLA
jgi:molecular chaperone Hsp33